MRDWKKFFQDNKSTLEANYPGLTQERFLREANEIDGEEEAFLRGVPFQYLLGYATFVDHDFKVTSDVLIPRSETEQLYELVDKWIKSHSAARRLVDVGTGSGCLGISLALAHPQLNVLLTDISPAALQVAETNSYNLKANVSLKLSDLLTGITGLFDVIVSNPPYIPSGHKAVHPKTDEFEPHLALYVDKDKYFDFFKKFFSQVSRHLTADGVFFLEGHEDFIEQLKAIAEESKLTSVEVIKDWAGRARFLKALAPKTPIG